MKLGNLVHRKSSIPIFGAIVGHAGIVVGTERVIDCNVGRGRNAVQEVSLNEFVAGEEFWGERELPGITGQQRIAIVARAREIDSWATEYDDAHNNQKGRWFNDGKPDKYWETDCVGLAEHCYEHAGLDIVPDEGIILTVPEQRDAMQLVHSLTPHGRANLYASWLQGQIGERELWLFHQEFPSDRFEGAPMVTLSLDQPADAKTTNDQVVAHSLRTGLITEEEAHLITQILSE